MLKRSDILVLTSQPDKAANLAFLLHLANLSTIHIADDIEAFNYLVQRQNSPQPISLLLVVDADVNRPILQLLDELKRRNALLPTLLVRGNSPIDIQQLTKDNEVISKLNQCDTSITHICVQEVLGSTFHDDTLGSCNSGE